MTFYRGNPLNYVMAKENRRAFKASIRNDRLTITITLPTKRVLEVLEEIEDCRNLSEKLRIIARELD